MRNLKLTLAFVGTAYHGFQVQKNARSVCAVFQDAVEAVFGTRYDVKGCSRTDAGVHANGFVLSLRCRETVPCDAVVRALNVHLPGDMAVLGCEEAPEDFHPRYSCRAKRYLYRIHNGPVRDPFARNLVLEYPRPIDLSTAESALRPLLGTHDFTSFCAAGGSVEDKVRTIFDCGVSRSGDLVTVSVTGDGFLYHMVRIMVGTMLEVCAGKYGPEQVAEMVEERNRAVAGVTAPAHGLYLDRVFYDEQWRQTGR